MKKTYLLLLFSFFVSAGFAQNIYFEFTDGTQEQFTVANIRNITFSGNSMNLNMKNGTTESWSVFDIGNYNYKGFSDTTGIGGPSSVNQKEAFTDLKLYPNPVSDVFMISFENENRKNVQVEILDLDGKLISSSNYEMSNGKSEVNLSKEIKHLPQGIYFCTLTSDKSSSTHKIIKK